MQVEMCLIKFLYLDVEVAATQVALAAQVAG